MSWTGGVTRTEADSKRISLEISARNDSRRYELANAHTVRKLSLPHQELNFHSLTDSFAHFQGLPIQPSLKGEPRLLIGLQHTDLLAPLEARLGNPDEPVAVRSRLGWAVYGLCKKPISSATTQHHLMRHDERENTSDGGDQELNQLLKDYFTLKEVGVKSGSLPENPEIARAKSLLRETTVRVGERFTTGLLWKSNDFHFPNSFPMALKRLQALERKLSKDPELKRDVHQQIKHYIDKGYAHKATRRELEEADPSRTWYLPLNVVSHPRKPEKKRLVWDAAAKHLEETWKRCSIKYGFVEKIPKHKGFYSGSTKVYLLQYIYIMDVATFGASCSPCSAQYIMHRNAEENALEFPEAAKAIQSKTYMDDYFDSCDTEAEAIQRAQQVKLIHARAGFNMRSWVSNCESVLKGMGEISDEPVPIVEHDSVGKPLRVLGMVWDPLKDVFKYTTNWRNDLMPYVLEKQRSTIRIALRIVMSLFDPLGLIGPILIHGRILMQDLWRDNLDWDSKMGDIEFEKWQRWIDLIQTINALEIPRIYFSNINLLEGKTLQLNVFTDASELAYGCAAYLRIAHDDQVQCSLVMARCKVAPLKHLTIPQLELQAALLGARLMHSVVQNHSLQINESYLHTDSEVVLSWITSQPREFKQFVACRKQLRPPRISPKILRSSYKRSRYLANELWDRWIKEYFPALNLRTKWHNDDVSLREGNLVLIAEGNRRDWIRGTIEEVHTGSDGIVREAMVRTANGKIVRRPAVKLAVIPAEVKSDEE
uniref:DUF5641 domain-containing protein n=1 Tax=Anopheles epiroticus TaxID=199890 RepID=A0A182PWL1_9DIPT